MKYRIINRVTQDIVWLHVNKVVELAPDNSLHSLHCSMVDATDLARAESQLGSTQQELGRALHIKDDFMANMHHEIRTVWLRRLE